MRQETNIQGLIFGGTELSLILQQEDFAGFTIFDTTVIHANSIVKYTLN